MRVGIYVDGYNLYYGGRKRCGRGTPGWRWLNVRGLARTTVAEQGQRWPAATVTRVVYCTARIDGATNPSGSADQDVYLRALRASGSVDHIEYGNYISKVIKRPLAVAGNRRRPVLVEPDWPVKIQRHGRPVPDAKFIASVATWEEKGSDVNVATHLLVDVLSQAVDAAVVISNDSDLRLPVREAWHRVPVGVVNPGSGYTAGDLSADANIGVGRHWWRTLTAADYTSHQLPDPVRAYHRPPGW
ncbi:MULTISPECIES: NYN domain-containing protein [unclassified Crossiella]|uniref:NYN domain-containing protein n=1 Tax=unclassified Crossiella TaxID=2620835 RepID=UPI001FFE3A4A|nr:MULTISPECIES: NYN domain-containing protein [unclassified Crossiella]MCK2236918.1 NYN domain-containing protein [Crossiella sp. S99.2]MCK2250586.1 NYN domain-containing protein [Crossiella sp. S99.1]